MTSKPVHKTFTVSLEHKKARGLGFERRDEILAAAKALFLKEGVERVSTRKLAQLVGLSQTGIYVYFKSKQAILAALIDTSFRKLWHSCCAIAAHRFIHAPWLIPAKKASKESRSLGNSRK